MTFVSQPTLVAHIAAPEKEVGARLVEKVGEVPRLTPGREIPARRADRGYQARPSGFGRNAARCRHVRSGSPSATTRPTSTAALTRPRSSISKAGPGIGSSSRSRRRVPTGPVRSTAVKIHFDIGARHRLLAGGDDRPHRTGIWATRCSFRRRWSRASCLCPTRARCSQRSASRRPTSTARPSCCPTPPARTRWEANLRRHSPRWGSNWAPPIEGSGHCTSTMSAIGERRWGVLSPSTTQNIGFIGEGKTRRAFSVPQLPLTTGDLHRLLPQEPLGREGRVRAGPRGGGVGRGAGWRPGGCRVGGRRMRVRALALLGSAMLPGSRARSCSTRSPGSRYARDARDVRQGGAS